MSALTVDDLGNPIENGEISVQTVKLIADNQILVGVHYPWMPLVQRRTAEGLGGAVLTSTEALLLAELLVEAARAAEEETDE